MCFMDYRQKGGDRSKSLSMGHELVIQAVGNITVIVLLYK